MAGRKVIPPEEPHIVEYIFDENGRKIAAIADNYCVRTKEEVDAILKRCGEIWSESLRRRAEREAMEAAKTVV